MEEKEKTIPTIHPIWRHPSVFDEDFWGLDSINQNGLSVSEDKTHVYVEAYLPGLSLKDIEVTFEKGVLWIRGEKKEEESNKKKKFYRKAINSFSYRLHVPGQIDEKKDPEAVYKDGVMTVSFAKSDKVKSRKIPIKTK